MKKPLTLSLLALLGVALAQPASAGNYASGAENIAKEQKREIRRGVKSGDLTHSEAKVLRKEQRRIARLYNDFSKDGNISHKERRILHKQYKKADKHINRLRSNHKYRHNRYGGDLYRWNYDYDYTSKPHYKKHYYGYRSKPHYKRHYYYGYKSKPHYKKHYYHGYKYKPYYKRHYYYGYKSKPHFGIWYRNNGYGVYGRW
ncbi:MAG: hypothetical protein MI754_07125 [Chromatiales bacterium]|nr:hypothetical protein [Chromatiales bacterium]